MLSKEEIKNITEKNHEFRWADEDFKNNPHRIYVALPSQEEGNMYDFGLCYSIEQAVYIMNQQNIYCSNEPFSFIYRRQ